MSEKTYKDIEDLEVYRLLCDLHIEVCACTDTWPKSEIYELGSQVRRSSNSSPSQLAEKNDDRHIKNKIEGVNRARGEAGETLHHLFMAKRKGYIDQNKFDVFKNSYKQCIRMLNGLERSLEKHLPTDDRRWPLVREERPELDASLDQNSYADLELSIYSPNPEHPALPSRLRRASPNTEHPAIH